MTDSQWSLVAKIGLAGLLATIGASVFYFHSFVMMPHSHDPDYMAVYYLERELYYGSRCGRLLNEIRADGIVETGLIECVPGFKLGFLNRKNGKVLRVQRHFSLKIGRLPSGEKVVIDVNNGYLFRCRNGKVTDFYPVKREDIPALLNPVPRKNSIRGDSGDETNK